MDLIISELRQKSQSSEFKYLLWEVKTRRLVWSSRVLFDLGASLFAKGNRPSQKIGG